MSPQRLIVRRLAQGVQSLKMIYTRLWRALADLSAGGEWTYQLPPVVRRSLRWFWFDGLFAASSDSIVASYLSLFVVALGGTRAQVGLASAVSNLTAAALLLPSAALVQRLGHHKQIVVGNSLIARLALLMMGLLPFLIGSGVGVVYGVIVLNMMYSAFANLSVPAWTPLTANLVPIQWRGRYFSARNTAMVIAGMAVTYGIGWLITHLGAPQGYQLAFILAFVIGMAASYSFWRIEVVPPAQEPAAHAPSSDNAPALRQLSGHPAFIGFCITAALFNFSVNVAGPFFNVYLVEKLGGTAGTVGLLNVVSSLAALPGYRLFGTLNDRWGSRKVLLLTGLLIPSMPLIWLFARAPWHVVPASLIGGFIWAGYGISSFSFQLELTPKENLSAWSALVHMLVLVSAAAGSAAGGLIAQRWGYAAIFIITAVGRLLAGLFFLQFVRTPDTSSPCGS